MKKDILSAILPEILVENFDIVDFQKSVDRFDVWMDEKRVLTKENRSNPNIVSNGFGEYRQIQDFPIRGRATFLHLRKCRWLNKSTGETFSYDWELDEHDATRLNAEFVAFLKGED